MTVKRLIALIAVLGVLAIGSATPRRAHADTTEAFILAGVAVGAYIGFVVIGTTLAYRTPPPSEFNDVQMSPMTICSLPRLPSRL